MSIKNQYSRNLDAFAFPSEPISSKMYAENIFWLFIDWKIFTLTYKYIGIG